MNKMVRFTTEEVEGAIAPMAYCDCVPTGLACEGCVSYIRMTRRNKREGMGISRLYWFIGSHIKHMGRAAAIRELTEVISTVLPTAMASIVAAYLED